MPALLLDPGVALVVLAIAGVLAGVINTLAGGGSFLILPLLIGLGMPPTIANGTSRIGVVLQGLSSAWTFHRRGIGEYRITARLAAPLTVGALFGAWLDTRPYEAWECETDISPADEPSPHGDKRICWNDAVVTSRGGSGAWPNGATVVKLHYTGSSISAISLETRVDDAEGPWFFYRRETSGAITNGRERTQGQTLCVGCHEDAPRDLVWEAGE